MADETPKRRRGRPKADISVSAIEKLSALSCTDEELAAYFSVTVQTIENKRKDPEYADAMRRGAAKGKLSLRRLQFRAAQNGDRTMLVWLGKQWLHQRDEQHVTVAEEPKESFPEWLRERLPEPDQPPENAEAKPNGHAAIN